MCACREVERQRAGRMVVTVTVHSTAQVPRRHPSTPASARKTEMPMRERQIHRRHETVSRPNPGGHDRHGRDRVAASTGQSGITRLEGRATTRAATTSQMSETAKKNVLLWIVMQQNKRVLDLFRHDSCTPTQGLSCARG